MEELCNKLRKRLTEYRYARRDKEVSTHIISIEIALGLVELSLNESRNIRLEEEQWFNASYYIQMVLEGSEWEDISDMYMDLKDAVESQNYLRISL